MLAKIFCAECRWDNLQVLPRLGHFCRSFFSLYFSVFCSWKQTVRTMSVKCYLKKLILHTQLKCESIERRTTCHNFLNMHMAQSPFLSKSCDFYSFNKLSCVTTLLFNKYIESCACVKPSLSNMIFFTAPKSSWLCYLHNHNLLLWIERKKQNHAWMFTRKKCITCNLHAPENCLVHMLHKKHFSWHVGTSGMNVFSTFWFVFCSFGLCFVILLCVVCFCISK